VGVVGEVARRCLRYSRWCGPAYPGATRGGLAVRMGPL